MPETWLCVLARDPSTSKTRLSGVLDPVWRASLAAAMLDDVLAVANEVSFARRLVVTESDLVCAAGQAVRVESLYVPATGTNDAASVAVREASGAGAKRLLLLAADLPYLVASDLELVLAEDARVVIAPDRHFRGTNALVLAPPSAIEPAFGEDSLREHRERARVASARAHIVTSRGLATDIDGPEDLRLLLREPGVGRRTREVLESVAFSAALAGPS